MKQRVYRFNLKALKKGRAFAWVVSTPPYPISQQGIELAEEYAMAKAVEECKAYGCGLVSLEMVSPR